ncbi:glutamine amidotransferase-related protein [Ehrlichia chaffeensis]|uniref:glutamine amidotransferase-related protein n=1 Tax=Ehrlichia chaffeensis TaxID=945 RepID=UPI0005C5DDDB|nr:gamma-glutamyl-gamma-aminobutyrate hydrolase family protein [Ehrlichia chaffeensis]
MKFIYRMKYAIIIVLFFIILFIPCTSVSVGCVRYDQKDIVVGLISTEFISYPNEYKTALGITQLLQSYGVRVVLMDYNVIMQLVKDEIVKINKTYKANCKISRYDIIESVVLKFIEEHNINRIFIPGNHYNISSLPIAPSLDRQLVTNAVVKIIHNQNHCIHLLGVCGGLQGIMYANGIKITRVKDIVNSDISVKSHTVSMPDPRSVYANLHKIKIFPNTRLSNIAVDLKLAKDQIIYFPDAHSEAIDSNVENVMKMYNLGYKIAAMSEDGVIEAIEDKYGNIYFQFHPEYLMINAERKFGDNTSRDTSIMLADAIIKDFLFRD